MTNAVSALPDLYDSDISLKRVAGGYEVGAYDGEDSLHDDANSEAAIDVAADRRTVVAGVAMSNPHQRCSEAITLTQGRCVLETS